MRRRRLQPPRFLQERRQARKQPTAPLPRPHPSIRLIRGGRRSCRTPGSTLVHVGAPAGAKAAVEPCTRDACRTAGFAAAAAPTGGWKRGAPTTTHNQGSASEPAAHERGRGAGGGRQLQERRGQPRAHARGHECRRRAPPRPRGRIGAAQTFRPRHATPRHQTKRSTREHRLPHHAEPASPPTPKFLLGRNEAKPRKPLQVAMPPVSNTSAWMRADSTPSSCSVAICASRKPTGPHR